MHLDEIKETFAKSLAGIQTAFEELTFGFLTVIDAHNKLEEKFDASQKDLDGEIAIAESELAVNRRRRVR